MTANAAPRARIPALDIARTAALAAMILFHFVFDLEMFGYVPFGTSTTGGWRILAVMTAGSFLALAGVSLWLAHGAGIRWRAFFWRFGKVAGAAALVSIGTYVVFPDAFVFFGILHSIALCSLFGLAALYLSWWACAVLAVGVFLAPDYLSAEVFNAPIWWWTGLHTIPLRTVDYEPIFPWFAPFLIGIAAAKLAGAAGVWARLEVAAPGRAARMLSWPGQHSLIIYLVHQPILIGLMWGFTALS